MTIGTFSIIFKNDGKLNLNKEDSENVNIVEEDPWSDSGWSTLSGNLFNEDK